MPETALAADRGALGQLVVLLRVSGQGGERLVEILQDYGKIRQIRLGLDVQVFVFFFQALVVLELGESAATLLLTTCRLTESWPVPPCTVGVSTSFRCIFLSLNSCRLKSCLLSNRRKSGLGFTSSVAILSFASSGLINQRLHRKAFF